MEDLKKYLMEMEEDELFRTQLSDVWVTLKQEYHYEGKILPNEDDVEDLFISVLKERANIIGAIIYSPQTKEYFSNIEGVVWTKDILKAQSLPLGAALLYSKLLLQGENRLSRLEYVISN